jgi:hypothetical protein
MEMWLISEVAVLLLDLVRKICLIGYSANPKGVWSIIEKEYDAAFCISHNNNHQQVRNRQIKEHLVLRMDHRCFNNWYFQRRGI